MKYHAPEDVAKVLEIQPPTLRKYAQLLERFGYTFEKNKQGWRWYSDTDIIALQKLIAFKHSGDMDLEAAAQAVLLWANGSDVSGRDTENKAIHNETEWHSIDVSQADRAQLLELMVEQRQIMGQMAEQNRAILSELTALRAEIRHLQAPETVEDTEGEPQKQLPPSTSAPLQEPQKRRSLWAWIFKK